MTRPPNIDEQISEVTREISLRESVYPRFIASGRMTQFKADMHLERMRAALETLQRVRQQADDGK